MHNQDLGRVAVVARGAYDPSAEYERLDAVSYNGSSYLVRKHCQGVEPAEGEYYMLMAKAGDSTAANAAAAEALAAAERADSASARADTAAGSAEHQASAAGAAADSANAAAGNANTAAAGASSAKQEAETAAAAANNAAASANKNAEAAATATSAANSAASRADDAASGANTARDAAGAAAEAANAAAAAAQNVVDSVQPDIAQVKQVLSAHGEALDNRIKKFYTGNLGAVNIADSDDGAVRNLVIGGRSEQYSTTGAQLFDMSLINDKESSGIVLEKTGDGGCRVSGTSTAVFVSNYVRLALAPGSYYFRDLYATPTARMVMRVTRNGVSSYYAGGKIEIQDLDITEFYIQVNEGVTVDIVLYPMLNTGETALPWEPYTGGAPSPSPEYPQKIKSVENCSMTVASADGGKAQTALIPVTLRGIGDVRDELYVYADGTGKLVQNLSYEKVNTNVAETDRESDEAISVRFKKGLSKYALKAFKSDKFIRGDTMKPYNFGTYQDYVFTSVPKEKYPTFQDALNYLQSIEFYILYSHEPIETVLAAEQVKALFDLRTYYGGTNISYQSENGVEPVVNFDYACALENFVEYIKAAQGDDRKFIYDMDERMTDAEYVAALAYVNSEYATALTELEV